MSGWGARIETCACGHPRAGTARGVGHFESGLGPCKNAGCDCRMYGPRAGEPMRMLLSDGSVFVVGDGQDTGIVEPAVVDAGWKRVRPAGGVWR